MWCTTSRKYVASSSPQICGHGRAFTFGEAHRLMTRFERPPLATCAAMPNGRCRIHGGKTPSGPAWPQFKTGKYSKVLKDLRLRERYEAALADPGIGELQAEIGLVDLRLMELCEQLQAGDNTGDLWELILAAIEQRRKLVDSLHKNAVGVVPVDCVIAFVHTVTNLVLEVVPDVKLKTLFLERLRILMGRRPDVPTVDVTH